VRSHFATTFTVRPRCFEPMTPENVRRRRGEVRLRPSELVKNAISLMTSSVGTAVLGFVFWAVAARLQAPKFVGRASAEIAAMILLSSLSQIGFGSTFERFLPIAGAATRRLVVRGYFLTTVIAAIISVGYLLLGFGHAFIEPTPTGRVVFVLASMGWTIFALQDGVLIALRSSRFVPLENIVFSAFKLALLPVMVSLSASRGIYFAWIIPVVGALAGVNWYLFRHRIPEHARVTADAPGLPPLREIATLALGGYVTNILSIFLTSVVALIVIVRLGAVQSAYFYLPAMIATALGQLLWNINVSFLVESSTTPDDMGDHIRSTARITALIFVPSAVGGIIFAPWILELFGARYSHHGTTLLRMLLLAALGTVITEFYSTLMWLERRVWWLAAREFASLVIYLGVLLALISHLGINAAGVAALSSSVLQAIFFLPYSIRRYRSATRPPAPVIP